MLHMLSWDVLRFESKKIVFRSFFSGLQLKRNKKNVVHSEKRSCDNLVKLLVKSDWAKFDSPGDAFFLLAGNCNCVLLGFPNSVILLIFPH